jgi:sulfoxide reductase heme-binding subunit YedZ
MSNTYNARLKKPSRLIWHSAIFFTSVALITFFFIIAPGEKTIFKLSIGTAYASMILLSMTLLIGPWNIYAKNKNPLSSYPRRDIGIWAGIIGIIHIVIGLQVHFGGVFLRYFIYPPNEQHILPIRYDLFGLANHTGLISGLIMIVLLAISSDFSLRKLGVKKWKKTQRFSYLGAGLIIIHGVIYQLLEKRNMTLVLVFLTVFLITCFAQLYGYMSYKKRI